MFNISSRNDANRSFLRDVVENWNQVNNLSGKHMSRSNGHMTDKQTNPRYISLIRLNICRRLWRLIGSCENGNLSIRFEGGENYPLESHSEASHSPWNLRRAPAFWRIWRRASPGVISSFDGYFNVIYLD